MTTNGQQETRSLPKNRKCGNCRFYEPAPLWRKGWCRNPRLYPPHSNHLVDSTTIDCEGGFRSRVYWEAIPLAEVMPDGLADGGQPADAPGGSNAANPVRPIEFNLPAGLTNLFNGNNNPIKPSTSTGQPATSHQSPSEPARGKRSLNLKLPFNITVTTGDPATQPEAPVATTALTPKQRKTLQGQDSHLPAPDAQSGDVIEIEAVEIEPPRPKLNKAKFSKFEANEDFSPEDLRNDASVDSYIDKEPLPPGIGMGKDWRPWLREKAPFTQPLPLEKIQFTPFVLGCIAVGFIAIIMLILVLTGGNKKDVTQPVTTISPSVAVSTTAPAAVTTRAAVTTAAATTSPAAKTAIVEGVGEIQLNLREQPDVKARLVSTIAEGERVAILEGPKDANGRVWYRIDHKGKQGWAVKDYLKVQN